MEGDVFYGKGREGGLLEGVGISRRVRKGKEGESTGRREGWFYGREGERRSGLCGGEGKGLFACESVPNVTTAATPPP